MSFLHRNGSAERSNVKHWEYVLTISCLRGSRSLIPKRRLRSSNRWCLFHRGRRRRRRLLAWHRRFARLLVMSPLGLLRRRCCLCWWHFGSPLLGLDAMHRSGSTCGVNRRRRCIRKRKSRERLCCGYTGSRLINNELFFFVEDHGSRVGNLGDLCRSSREVGNVLLLHRAINGLHEVALRFTSLWWLLSAMALSAACSLSIVAVVVVVVGTVSCIFTALAPRVAGTRVNGARSSIRNADTGGSTGGVFTPSLGNPCWSLSLGRSAPIFALMAAMTAKPLSLMLVINRIVSSSSPGRSALSCVIRILELFC